MAREAGIDGKNELGIPWKGGRGRSPRSFGMWKPGGMNGLAGPKCFCSSAIEGCSPSNLDTVRGVILVSVTLCLFFLGVTTKFNASSCSLSSSLSSSLSWPFVEGGYKDIIGGFVDMSPETDAGKEILGGAVEPVMIRLLLVFKAFDNDKGLAIASGLTTDLGVDLSLT